MAQILVIEDNLGIRENLVEILEINNYKVVTAENGKKGVLMATTLLPQAILSDILMPEMNGFEVFEQLKSNPLTTHIPFIFVTASAEKAEVQAGISMGAYAYVCKPFDADELLKIVETALCRAI